MHQFFLLIFYIQYNMLYTYFRAPAWVCWSPHKMCHRLASPVFLPHRPTLVLPVPPPLPLSLSPTPSPSSTSLFTNFYRSAFTVRLTSLSLLQLSPLMSPTSLPDSLFPLYHFFTSVSRNNHIYSTLFKTQEREPDRRSKEIERRKESQNTHTHKTKSSDLNLLY